MSGHAHYAEWDAAYVLGALSPAERREFELHLETCDRCRASIAELAPIPGLLARIDPATAEQLAEPDEHDELGAQRLVARVRADGARRARVRTAIVASLSAAAVVVGIAVVPASLGAYQPHPQPVAMQAVGDAAVSAQVTLTPVAWGTRIDLHCSYPDVGYGSWDYGLFVTDTDGATTEISTWRISAGQDAKLTAATALAPSQIATLQIRDLHDGTVVLQHTM